jgi:protocatechuate 3,4-dioxygenase beta subunit
MTASSPYFSEANSEQAVIGRTGPNANPRAKLIFDSLVRHLHAFLKETEPSVEEWMQGIQFLTRTGHLCTDWRQEFILLSDTLGASMLVETINNRKSSGETESTVLGPFHVAHAPHRPNGANICLDGKGEPLWVSGSVRDVEGRPIPGALLDVWQANAEGFYDVQQPNIQPDHNLRGLFEADAEGRYAFRTAHPRHYPIPDDGTVGEMLRALDRRPNRPAHIHFIVGADGFKPLTTHIFTRDCPWLNDDAVFGVKESLIADVLTINDRGRAEALGLPNPFREVTWDFVLGRHPTL